MAGDRTAKSELTFESGLERLFGNITWHNPFLLMALAEIGGFAERAPEWLQRSSANSTLRLALHGEMPVAAVLSVWRTLKTGSPDAVLAAVHRSVFDPERAFWAVCNLIQPLGLTGRAELVPFMLERLLDDGADQPFAINGIAIDLGRAGAWEQALDACATWRLHGHWAFANASSLRGRTLEARLSSAPDRNRPAAAAPTDGPSDRAERRAPAMGSSRLPDPRRTDGPRRAHHSTGAAAERLLSCRGDADCAGDTGAAELFLESYKLAHRLMPDPPPDEDDEDEDESVDPSEDATATSPASNEPVDLWPATLIAGVAENRLPARFISMLLPVFP